MKQSKVFERMAHEEDYRILRVNSIDEVEKIILKTQCSNKQLGIEKRESIRQI